MKLIHLGLEWFGDRAGGLERYQHEVCLAHAKMGNSVTAWIQSPSELEDQPVEYKRVVYASPADARKEKIKKLLSLVQTRFAVRDFTFISHHASISASVVSHLHGIPHVVHFQGPWADEAAIEGAPWWKTALQRRQEIKAYSSADRIITLSTAFRQLVVERYHVNPEIVHVVPGAINTTAANPGVSREYARKILGWPMDRPIVLSMRRLVRRVGVDVLLEAIARMRAKFSGDSDFLVLIGGTGPLRDELASRIVDLGLGTHVKLLGFVPDSDLSLAYRAADFTVVPTQFLEGFGLVTLESMAAGTPAVVTPVGSLPEIMNGLSKSLVMPGKSASEMADAIRGILDGQVKLPSETDCRDFVRNNYDWSVVAPRVLDVYRRATTASASK